MQIPMHKDSNAITANKCSHTYTRHFTNASVEVTAYVCKVCVINNIQNEYISTPGSWRETIPKQTKETIYVGNSLSE